jgi:quercetin dioxygenase-like cupin family protein
VVQVAVLFPKIWSSDLTRWVGSCRVKPLYQIDSEEAIMAVTTHEAIRVGEMVIRFLLKGDESGGSVAVFEFDVPAGAKVAAAHSHDGYDETIYGLEGILTWTLEGVAVDVGPGDALFIPRGAVHHFDNTHDADAKALAIVTPGILGPDFFREVAAVLDASAGGPPDVVALGEVMRRHGLTPAPSTRPSES